MPGSPATTYEELTDEAAIRSALTAILPAATCDTRGTDGGSSSKQPAPATSLADALFALQLVPFVHILTSRRTFALAHTQPPLSIVLDRATAGPQCYAATQLDWQYALVEVEAVVDSEQMREETEAGVGVKEKWEKRIDQAAAQVGLEEAGTFEGKVSTYLKKYNPTLRARLVEQSKQSQKQQT